MNKQEAIKKVEQMGEYEHFVDEPISKASVLNILSQLDEPQPHKVKVPQVAADYYYEQYKDKLSAFDEWFADFYDPDFEAEFPRAEELQNWLYGNDKKTNRQRELALATLIVNGLDAVEIEQEKLYTVTLPNPNRHDCDYGLCKVDGKIMIGTFVYGLTKASNARLTESEIKQDFEWARQFAEEITNEN